MSKARKAELSASTRAYRMGIIALPLRFAPRSRLVGTLSLRWG